MVGDSGAWRKLEGSRSKVDSRFPATKDVVGAGKGPRGYLRYRYLVERFSTMIANLPLPKA